MRSATSGKGGIWLIACLALALILSAPAAMAETRDFYFQRIGSDRGLTQNSITAMQQDSQGFMWVATQGGLHRYDGQRYVPYRHDPADLTALPDSYVTALALEESRQALWVGSYSAYVTRIDLQSGRLRHFPLGKDAGHAQRQVMAMLPLDKMLWVGTAAGLERFDPATGARVLAIPLDPAQSRAQPVQQLLADPQGNVWFACAIGLFRVSSDGRVTRVGPATPTYSLLLDHDGQLWAGRPDGLFRVTTGRDGPGMARQWPLDDGPAQLTGVRTLVEAPDHRLWLAVPGRGLLRYHVARKTGEWIHETPGLGTDLPEHSINALLIDKGGMLWVGGRYRGVAVADPSGTRFRQVVGLSEVTDEGSPAIQGESIRALQEGTPGKLWIATDTGRLLAYSLERDRFEDWTSRLPPLPAGTRPRRVLSMARDSGGRIWLATSHALLRLDPSSAIIEQVELGAYADANLRSILIDSHGDLWLGSVTQGALHYAMASAAITRYGAGNDAGAGGSLPHPTVHALLEDRRGRIWLGTGDGLAVLDRGDGSLRQFSQREPTATGLSGHLVRSLHQDVNGTIWVGTHTGLNEIEENAEGTITFHHPLADALGDKPEPAIFSITESADGMLWFGTDRGVVSFNPGSGRARTFGLADGLQDLEFNGGAVAELGDGRRAMGGIRGLNLFDPTRMVDADYLPPVRLLAARIGATAPSDAGALWQADQLEIPDGADILRLRIGALDYAPDVDTVYRYRMDGFDKDWIDNGAEPDITYTRLPPGRYRFRAQATDSNGAWSGQELQVPVIVRPPLWRHPLVLAALALGMLAMLAALAWRWQRRRDLEKGYFRQIREREERLSLALWASGEQFWDYDLSRGRLHRMANQEYDGKMPEMHSSATVDEHHEIHPDDQARVNDAMARHLRGDAPLFLSEHRSRQPDGQWAWVRARGRVVEWASDGRAGRVAGTARDVTERRSADRERRIAGEVLRSMAESVAVTDLDFLFVSVNPAFTRMTGFEQREVMGRSASLLDSSQHDAAFYHDLRDTLERTGGWSGEVWQQRKDGNELLCWLQASAVVDAANQRTHYVIVLSDITQQKRAEQELRYLANYDTLTSLPNRTLLSERLSQAIRQARRKNQKVAVLFLDLDRFKDINDSLGHAAGDQILRAAAARLQETVGIQHTVARLGGDEFTVVLEHVEDAAQAEAVAEQLLAAFETPLALNDRHDIVISPSIGISLYPDHAQVPTDLIKHADTAMYQAKAAGRRTFMPYSDTMDQQIRSRAVVSSALRKVLDRGELRLVFQPRLSLTSGRITGVEALLRWKSLEHGDIEPTRFIPLAEETGLILDIGEWALRQACGMLQQWREQGLDTLTMGVNVSALQLLRGDLPGVLERVLGETGVPANRLELELTESVIMSNAEKTVATLQAFRELGVGLAIDDFGTGYSSLAYLKRLPINTLKIDKEFIADLTRDPDDEAITSTVITMAHSLDLNVVAEGVETLGQMHFLRDHGCDEIQGYWLAKPLDPERCLAFLRAWSPLPAARHP